MTPLDNAIVQLRQAAQDVLAALEQKRLNDGDRLRIARLRELLAAPTHTPLTRDDVQRLAGFDEDPVVTLIFFDPPGVFDVALVGVVDVIRDGAHVLVTCYDRDICIERLMQVDGLSYEDATEHFDFNVAGGYLGEHTPVFLSRRVP